MPTKNERVRNLIENAGENFDPIHLAKDVLTILEEPTLFIVDGQEVPDEALHPDGRCTCAGEGECEWCTIHCLHCGGKAEEPVHRSDFAAEAHEFTSVRAGIKMPIEKWEERGRDA